MDAGLADFLVNLSPGLIVVIVVLGVHWISTKRGDKSELDKAFVMIVEFIKSVDGYDVNDPESRNELISSITRILEQSNINVDIHQINSMIDLALMFLWRTGVESEAIKIKLNRRVPNDTNAPTNATRDSSW